MINCKNSWVSTPITMAVMLGGSGFALMVQAGDWMLAPGVTVEQVYTDNANLDSEGAK